MVFVSCSPFCSLSEMLAAFRFAAVSAVMGIDSAVVHQHRMVQIFPSHALVTHCCSRPTNHPPTRLIRHCRCPSMISSPSPTPSKKVVLCCELLNLWKKRQGKKKKTRKRNTWPERCLSWVAPLSGRVTTHCIIYQPTGCFPFFFFTGRGPHCLASNPGPRWTHLPHTESKVWTKTFSNITRYIN